MRQANQNVARAVILTALTCSIVLPLSTARADVRTEARSYFRNGMAMIQEGKLDEGIRALEAAYDLLPHPNVLYNIARGYAEAGDYEGAIEYYERYLDSDPPDREEVNLFIQALEARMSAAERPSEKAEPSQALPEAPPSMPGATPDEIQALEDSATQIATLAEATQSDALRQRAERLRALASTLRERGEAAPEPSEPAEPGQPMIPMPEQPGMADAPTAPSGDLKLGALLQDDVYEEKVVSASRFAQSPLDAPNSMAIITRQDIRLSGIKDIGELVRRLAGAEVMMMGPGDTQMSLRGFNQRLSNKVLVLIDGRSTYVDFLSVTFVEHQPLNVEDIERIEVLRGPASALYGANSFAGVVNIITRAPGEEETMALAGVGNGGQYYGHVSNGGRIKRRLAYRVAAGYRRQNRMEKRVQPNRVDQQILKDPELAYENVHANASLKYRLAKDLQATAYGAIAKNLNHAFNSRGPNQEFDQEGLTGTVMTLLESSFGQIRAFWNHQELDGLPTAKQLGGDNFASIVASDIADVDMTVSQEFHLLVDHNLHVGFNYRYKRVDWTFIQGQFIEHHYGAYFQDTMDVADWMTLVGSFRVDLHPRLDDPMYAPRGAVLIRPAKGNTIRVSAGNAFRVPSFAETYFNFKSLASPGLFINTFGTETDEGQVITGGLGLLPEKIFSVEAGYINAQTDIFKGEANLYYNRVTDLIVAGLNFPNTPASPGLYTPAVNAWPLINTVQVNQPTAFDVIGGELIATLYPAKGLDVYANYAYNQTFGEFPAELVSFGGGNNSSRHKFNMGVQYRSPFGLDLSVDFHYSSEQVWPLVSVGDARTRIDNVLPAYYLVNARLGYRLFEDTLELGVSGYNVTDNRHRQHPFGQTISARVMGEIALRL